MTVAEIVEALGHAGVDVPGRGSKTISDALRWEIRKGSGPTYGPGHLRVRPDARVHRSLDALGAPERPTLIALASQRHGASLSLERQRHRRSHFCRTATLRVGHSVRVDVERLTAVLEQLFRQGAISSWAVDHGPDHMVRGTGARADQVLVVIPTAEELGAAQPALSEFGDQVVLWPGRFEPTA